MSNQRQPLTALLLCEEPEQIAQVSSMLQSEGIKVLACQDPERALEAIRDELHLPQIIVTNISSQRINAWSFCERLRSREFAAVPTIPILLTKTFECAGGDQNQGLHSVDGIAASGGLHTVIDLGDQIFLIHTWTHVSARHAIADILGRQFETALSGLGNHLGNELLRRVEVIEEAVTALLKRRISEELRRNGRQEAHKLSGCLGIHRFPEESQLAKDVEEQLSSHTFPSHLDALHLRDRVIQVKRKLLSEINQRESKGRGVSHAAKRTRTQALSRARE